MASKTKSASPPEVSYTTAMDKIRDEMAKSKDNYVQVVGEYMTGYLLAHPEAEAALMEKGKSISGSLKVVREEASKVKQGNMAILDDRTVYGIVLGYFGIESEAVNGRTTSSVSADALPPSPKGEGKGTGDAIQKPSPGASAEAGGRWHGASRDG